MRNTFSHNDVLVRTVGYEGYRGTEDECVCLWWNVWGSTTWRKGIKGGEISRRTGFSNDRRVQRLFSRWIGANYLTKRVINATVDSWGSIR